MQNTGSISVNIVESNSLDNEILITNETMGIYFRCIASRDNFLIIDSNTVVEGSGEFSIKPNGDEVISLIMIFHYLQVTKHLW